MATSHAKKIQRKTMISTNSIFTSQKTRIRG